MTFRHGATILCLVAGATAAIGAGDGHADPAAARAGLLQAHYDFAVAEYCGLIDRPVAIGYYLLRHDLLARGNINPDDNRSAWRKANLAADLEYQNRGLSGQRNWCRTEGAEAAGRFTSYFQRRQLP